RCFRFGQIDAASADAEAEQGTSFLIRLTFALLAVLAVAAGMENRADLWAAGGLVIFITAAVRLAARRWRDEWLLLATIAGNLAATLVGIHVLRGTNIPSASWWAPVLQINVIAAGCGALFWMKLREQFFASTLAASPATLLSAPVKAAWIAGLALWTIPAASQFFAPGTELPAEILSIAHWTGWLSLGLTVWGTR